MVAGCLPGESCSSRHISPPSALQAAVPVQSIASWCRHSRCTTLHRQHLVHQHHTTFHLRSTRCTKQHALTIHCTAEHSLHRIRCTSHCTYSLTHIHSAPYSLHHASLTHHSFTTPSMLLCWHSTQSGAQVVTMANKGADLSDIRKVIVATNNR